MAQRYNSQKTGRLKNAQKAKCQIAERIFIHRTSSVLTKWDHNICHQEFLTDFLIFYFVKTQLLLCFAQCLAQHSCLPIHTFASTICATHFQKSTWFEPFLTNALCDEGGDQKVCLGVKDFRGMESQLRKSLVGRISPKYNCTSNILWAEYHQSTSTIFSASFSISCSYILLILNHNM